MNVNIFHWGYQTTLVLSNQYQQKSACICAIYEYTYSMQLLQQSDSAYPAFRETLKRRAIPDTSVSEIVTGIIDDVKARGNQGAIPTRKAQSSESASPHLIGLESTFLAVRLRLSPPRS